MKIYKGAIFEGTNPDNGEKDLYKYVGRHKMSQCHFIGDKDNMPKEFKKKSDGSFIICSDRWIKEMKLKMLRNGKQNG